MVRALQGHPDIALRCLPESSVSTPFLGSPAPPGPSSWPSGLPPKRHSPQGLPTGTLNGVPASLPGHTPALRDLGHHPPVTWRPGPRPGGLYQLWLPPALVGEAPSYLWGLATPAGAVGETLVVGEEWLGGTCGSRDGSRFQGWRAGAGGKVKGRMAVPPERLKAM